MSIETSCRAGLLDIIDGLQSDLDGALEVLLRVCRGETAKSRGIEWLRLNYAEWLDKQPERYRRTPPEAFKDLLRRDNPEADEAEIERMCDDITGLRGIGDREGRR